MILGMTGSFGAGKGSVVEYLVSKKGFTHYSMSAYISEEVRRRGLPMHRDSTTLVADDLRKNHGPAYIVDTLYERALKQGGDVIIESLRARAEVSRIKELGGIVIGVDANPKLRYERAHARGREIDNVSFEIWLLQEKNESHPDDPTKGDIFGALAMSDYIIQNNGTLSELHENIEDVLSQIQAKR